MMVYVVYVVGMGYVLCMMCGDEMYKLHMVPNGPGGRVDSAPASCARGHLFNSCPNQNEETQNDEL